MWSSSSRASRCFQAVFSSLCFYFVELSFYSRGSCWRTPPRLDKLVAFLAPLNHNVGRMKEWSIVVERATEVFPYPVFYTLTCTIHVHVLCLFTNSIKKESKIWKASEVCVKDCVYMSWHKNAKCSFFEFSKVVEYTLLVASNNPGFSFYLPSFKLFYY